MYKAAVLALDGCYVSSLGGFADLLQVANSHLRQQQGAAANLFEWRFVCMTGETVCASNGLSIGVTRVDVREQFDVIYIPSLYYPGHQAFDRIIAGQKSACEWIGAQWRSGAVIAANCSGTFLLASTGLLDGRIATTTWWLEQQFRSRFPKVDLQIDPVVTEVDRLICAGASASYLLQAIRVIERFCGPTIAAQCAKTMLIDVSQTTQTPFLPLLSDRSHADSLVHRAQHLLQKKMAKETSMSELALALRVSERTVIRHFKAALGQTPLSYLQSLRIEAARKLLEGSKLSVERVAEQVGYLDTSSFSRLFRRMVGFSPGAYRSRFQGSQGLAPDDDRVVGVPKAAA